MNKLTKAICFAAQKHEGQKRKDGTPYIYHPLKVAEIVKDAGFNEDYQVVAILHDVLEDTNATEAEVREFGDDIFEAVFLLTKRSGLSEEEYVEKILKNNMAFIVKSADKMHNVWDISYYGTPGKTRSKEEKRTAKRYIDEAVKYYKGRFNAALDSAIRNARATVSIYKTPEKREQISFSKKDFTSFFELEKQRLERLKSIADTCEKPDLSRTDVEFFRLYDSFYCVYGKEFSKKWEYTEYGWIPTTVNLSDWVDGLSSPTYDQIISEVKRRGYKV